MELPVQFVYTENSKENTIKRIDFNRKWGNKK